VAQVAKYAALITLAGLHLFYIVILFSSYTVRRDLEADGAKLGGDASLDYLLMLSSKGGDTVRKVREYRCLQRDAITFYRIATMDVRRELSQVYAQTLQMRHAMRDFAEKEATLNRQETTKRFDNAWGVPLASDLVFLPSVAPDERQKTIERFRARQDESFDEFNASTSQHVKVASLLANAKQEVATPDDLRRAIQKRLQHERAIFDFSAVGTLEGALDKMNGEMKVAKLDDPKRVNILLRKISADDALAKRRSEASFLSEFAAQLDLTGQSGEALRDIDCEKLDQKLAMQIVQAMPQGRNLTEAQQELVKRYAIERSRGPSAGTALAQFANFLHDDVHGTLIRNFIGFPTSAQTFIVTMLFGSLGALSLQALRLSNRGYWGTISDPSWGEIVISMWLGMAAAIIVYLLASIGLLVVSDGRSNTAEVSTVGASLVALLGFVSGLLNDEAFARIRKFGLQFFQDDAAKAPDAEVSGPNADLAHRLQDANCTRFAELARLHCLGTTLAPKDHFTLFVPADSTFDGRPLSEWNALANPKQGAPFMALVNGRLLDTATLSAADLTTATQLVMADGSVVTLDKTDGVIRFKGERIELGQPYKWRNGTIFVTSP
jgi:uncharacterized surface protein with fasciclin (FAS1) repeats